MRHSALPLKRRILHSGAGGAGSPGNLGRATPCDCPRAGNLQGYRERRGQSARCSVRAMSANQATAAYSGVTPINPRWPLAGDAMSFSCSPEGDRSWPSAAPGNCEHGLSFLQSGRDDPSDLGTRFLAAILPWLQKHKPSTFNAIGCTLAINGRHSGATQRASEHFPERGHVREDLIPVSARSMGPDCRARSRPAAARAEAGWQSG